MKAGRGEGNRSTDDVLSRSGGTVASCSHDERFMGTRPRVGPWEKNGFGRGGAAFEGCVCAGRYEWACRGTFFNGMKVRPDAICLHLFLLTLLYNSLVDNPGLRLKIGTRPDSVRSLLPSNLPRNGDYLPHYCM